MKKQPFVFCFLLMIGWTFAFSVQAQISKRDTAYIADFDRPNVIEIYPGIYSTHFNFTSPHEHKTNFRLSANSSGYAGTYINYKWVSLKYSWAMPGTQLDKDVRLRYTSLSLRLSSKQMAFHPFYDSYNGLLMPAKEPGIHYKPFRGIQFSDAGIDLYYFANTGQFSYHAANYFSEIQKKSKGTVLVMVTPMWQKINWKNPSYQLITDTATYHLLASDPQWISLVGRIGFIYDLVFDHGLWSISPACLIGGGALRELNFKEDRLQAVNDLQAWINVGYNGPEFYAYVNAFWDNLQSNLLIKNLHQVNTDFSVTLGYRFHSASKKILHLL